MYRPSGQGLDDAKSRSMSELYEICMDYLQAPSLSTVPMILRLTASHAHLIWRPAG
jgi:hypothetical protein